MKHAWILLGFLALGCGGPPTVSFRPAAAATQQTGVEHTESAFLGKEDVGLYEQAWRPAQGTPKAILIVHHGLKDHSARYGEFATRMVQKNWAVHAYDMRGHGHSEVERVWVEHFDDYVDDLETFVRRVRAREGDKPIFLMGHSMGGAIVTLYALESRRLPRATL